MELSNLSNSARAEPLTIYPGAVLKGEVGRAGALRLPGDKSLSHRAALLAAMAEGHSRVDNFLVSGVTAVMLESLTVLGVGYRLEGRTLTVHGAGLGVASRLLRLKSGATLNCGNSATTLRLLVGALAAWGVEATLDGSAGLRRRPMRRIIEPLQQMGMEIISENGCAPLIIRPGLRPLRALNYRLAVASAQVKSCLLLAGLAAEGDTVLTEPGPSRDHTERMLSAMGVTVRRYPASGGNAASQASSSASDRLIPAQGDPNGSWITRISPPSPRRLRPLDLTIPGDMSAAAFLIVAALIAPGSELTLRGVGLNPTRTGLLDSLLEMGAEIAIENTAEIGGEPCGDLRVRHSRLHGVTVGGERVVRMIDEFPVFAIAAACASGETRVEDAAELRLKESDRISALGGELLRLGVDFSETPDGFIIQGGKTIGGGQVAAHGDHRLAMALAVAALAAEEPVTVSGAEMIDESFPDFVSILAALGTQTA